MRGYSVTAPSPSAFLVIAVAFPPVCTLVVALRFYARRQRRARILIDDWLTIPALISVTAMGILLIIGVAKQGLGYPTPQPADPNDAATFVSEPTTLVRKVGFYLELFSFIGISCIKLSFLFFYKRIFGTGGSILLLALLRFMMVACIIWGIGIFFSLLFICGTHFDSFWSNIANLSEHCTYLLDHQYVMAISDFVIDAIIFLIPIPLILRLHLSMLHKLGVLAVFMLGALTVAASITRMVIFIRANHNFQIQHEFHNNDNSSVLAGLYWTMFETGIGLIAVCLPSVYGIVKHYTQRNLGVQLSKPITSGQPGSFRIQSRFQRLSVPSEIEMGPGQARVANIDSSASKD